MISCATRGSSRTGLAGAGEACRCAADFSLEHNVSAVPPYVHESPSMSFRHFSPCSANCWKPACRHGDRAGSGVPAGQPLESRPARPRLREEADFYLSVRSSLPAHRYCTSYRWSAKSVRLMTSRSYQCGAEWCSTGAAYLSSGSLPLRLENQYFALDMHSDAANRCWSPGAA